MIIHLLTPGIQIEVILKKKTKYKIEDACDYISTEPQEKCKIKHLDVKDVFFSLVFLNRPSCFMCQFVININNMTRI